MGEEINVGSASSGNGGWNPISLCNRVVHEYSRTLDRFLWHFRAEVFKKNARDALSGDGLQSPKRLMTRDVAPFKTGSEWPSLEAEDDKKIHVRRCKTNIASRQILDTNIVTLIDAVRQ